MIAKTTFTKQGTNATTENFYKESAAEGTQLWRMVPLQKLSSIICECKKTFSTMRMAMIQVGDVSEDGVLLSGE